jgi:cobalamin biosynthesis protein CbiD
LWGGALPAAAVAAPPLVAQLLDLPTVEAATEVLASAGLNDVWDDVADRVVRRGRERLTRCRADREAMRVDCAVVAYNGEVLGRSAARSGSPPLDLGPPTPGRRL